VATVITENTFLLSSTTVLIWIATVLIVISYAFIHIEKMWADLTPAQIALALFVILVVFGIMTVANMCGTR
jgi:CHASE2 domain-containing sensor protein